MSYPRFISCALRDLLGSEYAKPDAVGFEPDVLHKANYSRDPLEVTPVTLTTYMRTAIQGDNKISPVPSPTKKVKRKKGQGSRKVAQPKSLDTEISDPKLAKRGQQQPPLTADTLRIITQSLAPKQRPTEGTKTSHSVSSGKPVPKDSTAINKTVESEPTKPSHPAKDSGKSQPEYQGVRGPKPSVEHHYSTEKGIHKQSHPAKGSDKSQSGSQGEKGSKSSVGQHYSTEKGTHKHSHPTKGSGKSQPEHQGVLAPKTSTGQNKPVGKGGITTHVPDEGIRKSKLLSEGTKTHPQDSEGNIQPVDRETTFTSGGAQNLGTDLEDQVDKTQSTGFEGSGPSQNEGKSSNEEEPDNLLLQITSLADAQAALFSDDEYNSDEEVFTAGDDMEVEETVPEPINQSPQSPNHGEAETHSEPESSGDDQAPLTEKAFTKFIKKMTNILYRGSLTRCLTCILSKQSIITSSRMQLNTTMMMSGSKIPLSPTP
jgi:hypothetical protein